MKDIIFLYLLVLSVLLLDNCTGQTKSVKVQAVDTTLVNHLDSLFNEGVKSNQLAGASVLVAKGDKVLAQQNYGYASLESKIKMPQNPVFEIGSVTKQFTAAAILKLEEQGRLSISDDFTRYLPFNTQGHAISIEQLLNHTSGIASYTEMGEFFEIMTKELPRDTLVRMAEAKGITFEPGTSLIYNNTAYFILGLIIEKVTGRSYESYLSEVFFQPLGMKNTYYCPNKIKNKRRVEGYGYLDGKLAPKVFIDRRWPYAAGSLCSTTEDLLIWLKALHKGKVLSSYSYQKLIEPTILTDGTATRYAKGLYNYSYYGNQVIGHGGGIPGFLSETRYFPEEDLFVICLVNSIGPLSTDFFADEITWQVLDKKNPEKVSLPVSQYFGKYSGMTRGGKYSIEVSINSEGLEVKNLSNNHSDTLRHYLGEGKWMDGNDIIQVSAQAYFLDNVYGCYRLNKLLDYK